MNNDKKHIKEFQDFSGEEDIFEMANYRPETTSLPMIIWVSSKGFTKHSLRIKVQSNYNTKVNPSETFAVSIHSPKIEAGTQGDITNDDLQKVFKWIQLNTENLMKLWNYEFDFNDFVKNIIKI